MPVFHRYGLHSATDEQVAAALSSTVADLTARYPTRADLVHAVLLAA